MLVGTQAATDYRQPYIHSLEAVELSTFIGSPWYETVLPALNRSSHDDWHVLEALLTELDSAGGMILGGVKIGPIARVEFIWKRDKSLEYRGAVLFDNNGEAIIHAMHALLGYVGSGPIFSRQIMTKLGVPVEMFNEINSSVKPYEYDTVVFSREARGVTIGRSTLTDGHQHTDYRPEPVSTYPGAPVSSIWKVWKT